MNYSHDFNVVFDRDLTCIGYPRYTLPGCSWDFSESRGIRCEIESCGGGQVCYMHLSPGSMLLMCYGLHRMFGYQGCLAILLTRIV